MAMTTSKTGYRHGYQPLPSGIFVAPYPYAYWYGWDEETTVEFCKRQLDLVLRSQTGPEELAAIIIEPVLGEGGYVPAPAGFLHHLRDVCDQYGILLIMDEVQSGFGRTGRFFCFQHSDVRPDVIVMAKGLGSGLPISAVAATAEMMDKWIPGTHGGTYGGGSTVPLTAALATIEVLQEENLVDNARRRGEQLMAGLRRLQKVYPVIGDVRGKGLMVAVEFSRQGNPDAAMASKVLRACIGRKLLLLSCGTYKNVIRWIPPLIVNDQQIAEALESFARALEESA